MNCPNCAHHKTELFYSINNAPVHSSLLLESREKALKTEKRPIELTVCHNCGFIFNQAYDHSVHLNVEGHEDQQGFSPTFMNFVSGIAQKEIDKYNIRKKTILEIGCGKGDFLKLICDMGNNRGIGIDPAINYSRLTSTDNLKFIKDYYNTSHSTLKTDFICCRHTLEHIPKTNEFLKLLSENIKPHPAQPLLFEVPDTERILNDVAFWDIYYEHCSYFTRNSLTFLFENNNFNVNETWLDYNGQYIMLEAFSNYKSSKLFDKSIVNETLKLTNNFKQKLNESRKEWHKILNHLSENNKNVVLWGGGSKPVGFLSLFSEFNIFKAIVDINPNMNGKFVPVFGLETILPERLSEIDVEVVIIMNSIYKDEITAQLHQMDIFPIIYAI